LEGIPLSGPVIGHTTARSFPTSRNGTPCRTKDPTSTSRTLLDLLMATTASSRALGETMVGRLQAGSSPAWGRKWTKTKSSASEATSALAPMTPDGCQSPSYYGCACEPRGCYPTVEPVRPSAPSPLMSETGPKSARARGTGLFHRVNRPGHETGGKSPLPPGK